MQINYKHAPIILTAVLALSLLVTFSVLAGNIDSSAAPNATSSYTLADIYNRLNAGTAGSQSTFTEPASGPGSTMADLNSIMAAAPVLDAANGAAAADVAGGKTFWNLTSGAWGLQTGTGLIAAYAAPAAKTGQTTSYATGDDGELQRGVDWPNPRFTDNGDGTVTDNLTGLIWLTNAHCAATGRTWATALTDVDSLNAAGTMNGNNCGDSSNGGSHQTDWRLPNVRELQSLAHYGFFSPALPNTAGTGQWSAGDPFTNVGSTSLYWSSTSRTDFSSNAWYVHMCCGVTDTTSKTGGAAVWPVRAGQ